MAITLPDARQLSDDILEAFRLRAINGRELGFTEADLANLLGVSRETVCRWWSAYMTHGLDALPHKRTGRPLGSGRLLSEEQAGRVQRLLDEKSPGDLGIPAPLWNRRAVRDLIRKECGVLLAVRTVGRYLGRWGYTAKKPSRHAKKQDPEEIRQWLEETYPAIEGRAAEEGAEIYSCDETGLMRTSTPATATREKGSRRQWKCRNRTSA
jgi:transposase